MELSIPIVTSLFLFLPFGAPIKCYICHKDISNCTGSPLPLSLLRDCDADVTACFTQADQIIVRGCFHHTSSISMRAFTRLCHEDGCNDEPFISPSKLKCAMCDAQGCQSELVQCNYDILLYRKDFCYSAWSPVEEVLLRGCLFAAEESIQRQCNPMDSHRDNCLTCQFNGCNRELRPPQSSRCMSTSVKAAVDCRSYKISRRLGCFASNLNGRFELGCNTQRGEEEFLQCANISNNTCQLCMTSMCNNLEESRLQSCAYGTGDLALSPKICKSASDRCVMFSAFNQSLYNCESSMICLSPYCYFCTGYMCNWDLKPSLSCHVCSSNESCAQDLTSVDRFKRVCKLAHRSTDEACFSVIDDKNEIHRGCYAEEPSLCDSFSSKCLKCKDSNYCNKAEVVKSALVCFSCTTDDPHCPIERSTSSVTSKCLDHFRGQQESCYDILDRVTKKVERGCSLDIPRDRLLRLSSLITYCDSHFCNAQGHEVRRCISCTGTHLNSSCHSLGADSLLMVSECHSILGRMEAGNCYTMFSNRTKIMRGCQVNLTKTEIVFCKGSLNEFCHVCGENTCNKVKLWYESCFVCNQNCTIRAGNATNVEFRGVVTVARACQNVSTGERNGCFLRLIGEGQWKQGCIADMPMEAYKMCLADDKSCQICTGDGCNYKVRTASSGLKTLDDMIHLNNGRGRSRGGGGIVVMMSSILITYFGGQSK